MELTTDYMGLRLANPLVASPSPLSYSLDGVRRLADAGVGAIVLFSLFEEQVREQALRTARLVDASADSFPEALDMFPAVAGEDSGPNRYLSLLEPRRDRRRRPGDGQPERCNAARVDQLRKIQCRMPARPRSN